VSDRFRVGIVVSSGTDGGANDISASCMQGWSNAGMNRFPSVTFPGGRWHRYQPASQASGAGKAHGGAVPVRSPIVDRFSEPFAASTRSSHSTCFICSTSENRSSSRKRLPGWHRSCGPNTEFFRTVPAPLFCELCTSVPEDQCTRSCACRRQSRETPRRYSEGRRLPESYPTRSTSSATGRLCRPSGPTHAGGWEFPQRLSCC